MNGVNLNRAILDGVDLSGADLNLIKNITFEQLLSAKTLYRSENLDPLIEKQLRVVKSCLFEDPNSLNGCKEDIFLPVPPTELVPAGTFTMGCLSEERDGQCNDDEKPAREVKVDTFYMGKYEVTNEEFAAFLNAKGNQEEGEITWVNLSGSFQGVKCRIQKDGDRFVVEEGFEKYPMIYVSCYGARAYCKWLSEQTGQNYRLPSEAEWEYAARGGEQGARDNFLYSGSDNIDEVAWYANNSGRQIYEVGKKQPNQLDLYDMSGNIWEWCADSWHDNYDNAPKNAKVWDEGGDNTRRVLRGGSWFNTSEVYCRIADRYGDYLVDRFNFVGFRVVRDP
jgi:formylglycine-generating enzyme required for sulfatase activity